MPTAERPGTPADAPRIGVVIVNYNGRAYVGRCLRSLGRSTVAPAAVVMVDNASTDGSPSEIAREFPDVSIIRNAANEGFSGGVNAGVRSCLDNHLDAVFLLNPDAEVTPSCIGELARGMDRHPDAILAPFIGAADDPDRNGTYVGSIVWWRGRMGARYLYARDAGLRTDERITTASGCALLLPAHVFDSPGMFDESYFLYFEDADYLERCRRAGIELWYVPAARLVHREGSATGGPTSPLALYYYIRNRYLFVRKFQRGTLPHAVFLVYSSVDVCVRAFVWFTRGRPDLMSAVFRGAMHGWRGITGPDPAR